LLIFFRYKWDIPIKYTTAVDSSQKLTWLKRDMAQIEIPIPNTVPWVKINSKQVGIYRVNYEPSEWLVLSENMKVRMKTKDVGKLMTSFRHNGFCRTTKIHTKVSRASGGLTSILFLLQPLSRHFIW